MLVIFSWAIIACDDDGGSKTRVSSTLEGAPLSVFAATDGDGRELWITDGTEEGTEQVRDINEGAGDGIPDELKNEFAYLNGKAYFQATNGSDGYELWVSDGTAVGTEMLDDFNTGSGDFNPYGFTLFNGRLYFAGTTSTGTELWKTDGTAAGTIKAPAAGEPTLLNPTGMAVYNGKLYFSAADSGDTDLWCIDRTGDASEIEVNSGGSGNPMHLTEMDDMLYFTAVTASYGRELWKTDGTQANTALVSDIDSDTTGSINDTLVVYNDKLYFAADDGESGNELWCSDGTEEGTRCAADINEGAGNSNPDEMIVFNGRLYFSATSAGQNRLYVFDSTTGTAGEIRMTYETYTAYSPMFLSVFNGNIYFRAEITALGNDLWVSDGTAEGTQLVEQINTTAEPSNSNPWNFTVMEDRLYFCADDGAHYFELWTSDGTSDGTSMVRDIYVGGVTDGSWPFGVD